MSPKRAAPINTAVEVCIGSQSGVQVDKHLQCAGYAFTIHDLRRTMRTNAAPLKIDFETAEKMMGHTKKALDKTYNRYEFLDEKREGFRRWEAKLVGMAREAGVAEALGIPA